MDYKVYPIPSIVRVKGYRGEILSIDMKEVFDGTLEAWMMKKTNSTTYRSFSILDNRYLILSKDKASDYKDADDNIIESISGKWYFDVRQTIDPQKPEEARIIFRGEIFFINDVVGNPVLRAVETI